MEDKERLAIRRIIEAAEMSERYYKQPLLVTTSGGKDSSVCVELALRAGIEFKVAHNHTTADAPETMRFVRSEFKRLEGMGIRCIVNYPIYKGKPTSMWNLIPQKLMPPTRAVRYCCAILKERCGRGRYITTGVRWAESKLDGSWNMGTSAEEVFHWWMEDGVLPGQINFEEYAELMAA